MKMTKEKFIDQLIEEAKKNNIEVTSNQAEKLYIYKELLLEWNEKLNLTSITDDEDIIVKHFIDSLLCIDYIKENDKLIDIGTGAGFPGIVLAIYFDGKVNITLLDSLQKRVNFLEVIINELKLNNVEAIHARAEELGHDDKYREKYDIAIARAVAPLNILLEYLVGYIKVNGKCICMKANNTEEELRSSNNAIKTLNLGLSSNNKKNIKYKEELTRYILVFNKQKELAMKYPRSYAKIKKSPL